MEQSERAAHNEGGEPQVLAVQPGHYRLYNVLTAALVFCILFILLGSLICAGFILPTFVSLFEGMNLTLPLPTKILIMMMKPGLGLLLLLAMVAGFAVVVLILAFFLMKKARRDFLTAVLVEMTVFLCLQLLLMMVFFGMMMAVFLPLYQLMGRLN